MAKYCRICPDYQIKETSAGLAHQLSIVVCLYLHCKKEGLTPLLPKLILTAGHNNGKAKALEDYVDFPDDFVIDTPTIEAITFQFNYLDYPFLAKPMRTYFPFKNRFKTMAKSIVAKMTNPICCLRVRRGDMLIARPECDISIEDINKVLAKYNYNSLYLMTDEKNKNFFNGIEKKYQAFDFPELASLTDNYELFAIECCMRDLCDIRIGMFSSGDTEYYHASLFPIFGIH